MDTTNTAAPERRHFSAAEAEAMLEIDLPVLYNLSDGPCIMRVAGIRDGNYRFDFLYEGQWLAGSSWIRRDWAIHALVTKGVERVTVKLAVPEPEKKVKAPTEIVEEGSPVPSTVVSAAQRATYLALHTLANGGTAEFSTSAIAKSMNKPTAAVNSALGALAKAKHVASRTDGEIFWKLAVAK